MQQQQGAPVAVAQPYISSDIRAEPNACDMPDRKRQALEAVLPDPLTETVVEQALRELNQGTARAVQSCIDCFRNKRMTGDDLQSFIRSISPQSRTLSELYQKEPRVLDQGEQDMGEAACADDLALPAIYCYCVSGGAEQEQSDEHDCQSACSSDRCVTNCAQSVQLAVLHN